MLNIHTYYILWNVSLGYCFKLFNHFCLETEDRHKHPCTIDVGVGHDSFQPKECGKKWYCISSEPKS